MMNTPAMAEHVLVTHVKNYVKQTRGYDALRTVLGNGLLTSEGNFWLRQRRLMQPAFHRERLQRFADVMVRAAVDRAAAWAPRVADGQPFDIHHEMMAVTLRVVAETLMSTDVSGESDRVGIALTEVLEQMVYRTTHPLVAPLWFPTRRNRKFRHARSTLNEVVLSMIARRREERDRVPHDLLQMLLEARDDDGSMMSDAQLKDEVMTLFLAGHETTANTLSWTFMLLSQNPEVEERLRAELAEVLQGQLPTAADMARLPLHTHVIQEALRLYPPVWSLGRKALEDDVVDGYRVEKDSLVFLSPFTLHRLPSIWPEPERFNPYRWANTGESREGGRPRGAYLPFSTGARKCIGDMFAMMEAVLMLATFLQRVRLRLVPGAHVEVEPVITLRPRNGVPVTAQAAPTFSSRASSVAAGTGVSAVRANLGK
jgi:cytochrome P450